MTLLHLFNFLILQWLGLRLAAIVEEAGADGMNPPIETVITGWTIIRVLPVSGYFGLPFVYWGGAIPLKLKK